MIGKNVSKSITYLAETLEKSDIEVIDLYKLKDHTSYSEVSSIFNGFDSAIKRIDHYKKDLIKITEDKALTTIAKRVAHDIRSPVSALEMVSKDLEGITSDKKTLIIEATTRIQDIANNLLENERPHPQTNGTVALKPLIESLLTEKRIQFRNFLNLTISLHQEKDSYNLFAKLDPIEFKRVLSNIINNSAEAISGKDGQIEIKAYSESPWAVIEVQDNGHGIPYDVLTKIKEGKEITYGKPMGNGIGLSSASQYINSISGKLTINSSPKWGTSIRIQLPLALPPKWFISSLKLDNDTQVIILDDENTIHKVWAEKLKSISNKKVHISTPEELEKVLSLTSDNFLLLSDFELNGFNESGLDLIQKFQVAKKSVLVTSHFEDEEIQKKCIEMGLKMIPKNMIMDVSVKSVPLSNHKNKLIVHLDDDPLVILTWKAQAKKQSINLLSFSRFQELEPKLSTIPFDSIFYIDQELGDDTRGLEIAEQLFRKGYHHIILSTGHIDKELKDSPFIKKVIGKTPPWES
ncbi:MAG: sensor histidine kinase [Bacteriovoracaceae bacterium]